MDDVRWRSLLAAIALLPAFVGCAGSSSDDGDCTSHYEPVAQAPTKASLKHTLLHDVDPRVRSLKVIDEDPSDDKVIVNLLNRRGRVVMSLDVWRREDGTWTAEQWSQCID